MSPAQATVSPSSTSRSPAPAASPTPGKTTITSSDDAALRARLVQHAGATFDDGGRYLWQIQPTGDFLCTTQPPTAMNRSVGHAITQADNLVSWRQLGACAMVQLEPAAAPGASPAPGAPATGAPPSPGASPAPDTASQTSPTAAAPAAPAAPAAQSGFSLEGFLGAMFAGVTSLFDVGSQVDTPASGAPAAASGAAPASSQPAVPTPEPKMPGAPEPEPEDPPGTRAPEPRLEKAPALSQALWYDESFKPLAPAEVATATQVLSSVFGIAKASEVVTTLDDEVRKQHSYNGYYFFDASGKPCSGAKATQYVYFSFDEQGPVSPVALWLGKNHPGYRPRYMKRTGKARVFQDAPGTGWTEIPHSAQQLNLRNIPGPLACFSTAEIMLAQLGLHEVAAGGPDSIGKLITGETYEEQKAPGHSYHYVKTVTPDPSAARMAKAYLDWELGRGKPAMLGVTYKDTNVNDDGITDHWIIATRLAGDGCYAFNDPATGDGAATLAWTSNDRFHCADRRYYVTMVRPNESSLKEWKEHWKSVQPGAPGAAAPGTAAPGAAAPGTATP
jgi:hypothetical protein